MMDTLYLQLRAGPIHLMVDASAVHEVVTQDPQQGADRIHVQWRGAVLAVVPLARFLGFGHAPSAAGIVYAPDADAVPVMLAIDEVVGLQQAMTNAWRRLPPVPEATARLFDAVYLDPHHPGRLAYRLRQDLDPNSFGLPDERLLSLEG